MGPNRLNELLGVHNFRIFPHLDWQTDNGIFNRPVMECSQVLLHRWGPEQGFQCCFADGLNQRVVLSATRPATPREDKLPLKPPSRRDVALILV